MEITRNEQKDLCANVYHNIISDRKKWNIQYKDWLNKLTHLYEGIPCNISKDFEGYPNIREKAPVK